MDVTVIAASCCRVALDDETTTQLQNQKFLHMAAQNLERRIKDGDGGGMDDAGGSGGGGGGRAEPNEATLVAANLLACENYGLLPPPLGVKVGAGSEGGGKGEEG